MSNLRQAGPAADLLVRDQAARGGVRRLPARSNELLPSATWVPAGKGRFGCAVGEPLHHLGSNPGLNELVG